jgi:hypothetical protein
MVCVCVCVCVSVCAAVGWRENVTRLGCRYMLGVYRPSTGVVTLLQVPFVNIGEARAAPIIPDHSQWFLVKERRLARKRSAAQPTPEGPSNAALTKGASADTCRLHARLTPLRRPRGYIWRPQEAAAAGDTRAHTHRCVVYAGTRGCLQVRVSSILPYGSVSLSRS